MNFFNPRATHLLLRHQEIALKGRNRPEFERRLQKSVELCLKQTGAGEFKSASGRFLIELKPGLAGTDIQVIMKRLSNISGIASVTPCAKVASQPESIQTEALEWAKQELASQPQAATFAVRSRRVDKKFQLSSAELDFMLGSQIKKLKENLLVKLKSPDVVIKVEVRDKLTLVYSSELEGTKGLPMDTSQRVVCLLSGGIDSPVAAAEIMRRGCTPVFVHFHSKPYTSDATILKVKRLAQTVRKLSPYPLELWLVPLLPVQKAVRDMCNERYRTVFYRRFMMKIAQELAHRRLALGIVTGESLGQVASQTLTNMGTIQNGIQLPVIRPLVTLDKEQIISKAKNIGTYEISVEPHDDTCILFAPLKPATQARLPVILDEEGRLPTYNLVFEALDAAEKVLI